ncbi:DUF2235 domain-containing protein [Pseudovibrio sp. Ad26]|uniref:T6SS phospholipase effector Tle1-like catalytic domain-containing protein n=1 Tax=Pseudovibrio sp. Ad26 TaxID=989410 RepID=UPI0007AEA2FB|nr:DUF2235 domain-containing protein [Pseudovibrio sp. Ad26]KZL09062.1 hypothetical protein PsAD26_03391 [Pseudovibrio sp. Ad26]
MKSDFPNKPISSCEVCEYVLRIGVFFDGTLNNAQNIAYYNKLPNSKKRNVPDSYKSDYTNIWKLHQIYPQSHSQGELNDERVIFGSVYVEGVGTNTLKDDEKFLTGGAATGTGFTGVIAKSEKGAQAAWEFVDTYANYNITRIEIDIFGFSRGAATARHFANLISETSGIYSRFRHKAKNYGRRPKRWERALVPVDGMLGPKRTSKRHKGTLYSVFTGIPTQINFIGLFDTVPSITALLRGDFSAMNDRNAPVITSLPPGIAKEKIVQLAAINERRENFGLKSILSKPVSCKTPEIKTEGNHIEECMYGAHSDIGGGYVSKGYDVDLGTDEGAAAQAIEEGRIGDIQDVDITRSGSEEVWVYKGETGRIVRTIEKENILWPGPTKEYHTTMERKYVDGAYSRIALHKMHDYAVASQVPFIALDHEDGEGSKEANPISELTNIPDELKFIDEKIHKGEPLSDDELKLLKKKYLHHSDNYEGIGHDPHESGQRLIFPN